MVSRSASDAVDGNSRTLTEAFDGETQGTWSESLPVGTIPRRTWPWSPNRSIDGYS